MEPKFDENDDSVDELDSDTDYDDNSFQFIVSVQIFMLKASILFPYFFIYKSHFKKVEKDRPSTRKVKLTN